MNGSKGNEGGTWTYMGKNGASVIDYAVVNERAAEEIQEMEVEDRTESDHMPIKVRIQGPKLTGKEEEEEEVAKSDWSQEGIETYKDKLGGWGHRKMEKTELWQEISDKVKEATKIKKVKIGLEIGKRKWRDKEWKEKKRLLRKELRKWKKNKIGREDYVKKRKEYREWCEEKRKKHEEEEQERIDRIKNESEAWKYINRFRKRKRTVKKTISMEE